MRISYKTLLDLADGGDEEAKAVSVFYVETLICRVSTQCFYSGESDCLLLSLDGTEDAPMIRRIVPEEQFLLRAPAPNMDLPIGSSIGCMVEETREFLLPPSIDI